MREPFGSAKTVVERFVDRTWRDVTRGFGDGVDGDI